MNKEDKKLPLEAKEDKSEAHKISTPLDNDYSLWIELREKAPGTYKHTQTLCDLVDTAAGAIKLDSENLRLAARFHDIGKTWFPKAFTENQGKENIHDAIEPNISHIILTRHVSDTVVIMLNCGFPFEAIKIAGQHHGTSVLSAVWEKAKNKGNKDDFRYKTEKPASLEAMILMLCDKLEAASRSIYLDQKHEVDPENLVMNIYNSLLNDGQFDNVMIKLGQLKEIQHALTEDIAGSFHKRIPYEEDKELVKAQE